MQPTPTWVPIYGAALATLVALWNIYQWWIKGPKLVGYASVNMTVLGGIVPDHNTYVVLTVVNRGDAATTINNLGLLGYSNWFNYIRGKTAKAGIIQGGGSLGTPIPSQLLPGHEFKGFAIQNSDLENWSKTQLLFICVWHTMSNKPYRIRLKSIVPYERKNNG